MYEKKPYIEIKNKYPLTEGYPNISEKILKDCDTNNCKNVVLDLYPGLEAKKIAKELFDNKQINIIYTDEFSVGVNEYKKITKFNRTDDELFGVNSFFNINDFFRVDATKQLENKLLENSVNIIIGVGASKLVNYDLLIYLDITRWEIRNRYRKKEMGNWLMDNKDENEDRKYKIGFFIEWKFADKHKKKIYNKIDHYIDMNNSLSPLMVSGLDYQTALKTTSKRPFKLVPFFDSSVWGGQWMKREFKLDTTKENYGWAFTGVPDENSLLFKFSNRYLEVPAGNLIDQFPRNVLGDLVYNRFGTQFPIRFNYLDTIEGENLSLQVHPTTDYIKDNFGMPFTQDESYYVIEAEEDSIVYLGVKNNVDKNKMFSDLKKSQATGEIFDTKKYVNEFPVKKHDHFLIPGGTIHSSGANNVVLEISSTIDLFTFKLWDWGRLGLDGKPRPINIEHGEPNVLTERDTDFCKKELINNINVIKDEKKYKLERTGLHELEFIGTNRHTIRNNAKEKISLKKSVSVFTLVEGSQIKVRFGDSEEMFISYAETFIVPDFCKEVELENFENDSVILIEAFVKTN